MMETLDDKARATLRELIVLFAQDHAPEEGDYQSFADSCEYDLYALLDDFDLTGAVIEWDSDGEHDQGICLRMPDSELIAVENPFDTDEEDWPISDEAVDKCLENLLEIRAVYAQALLAGRHAFKAALEATPAWRRAAGKETPT